MKHTTNALLLLAGIALSGIHARAQDGMGGPGQGGPGQGGPGQGGPGQGGPGQGAGRGGRGNRGPQLTPQQLQQLREQALKTQMTEIGVPEAAQTTILAYMAARETAALPLRAQARTLQQGLANNISAEVAARQLAALREAIKVERERRVTAEKELDTAVGYTKSPQLEAYLTVTGMIGDEGAILAPPGGGPGGRGGRGGRGGGQGGPGQGGGQGGPEAGPGAGEAPAAG